MKLSQWLKQNQFEFQQHTQSEQVRQNLIMFSKITCEVTPEPRSTPSRKLCDATITKRCSPKLNKASRLKN